MVHLPARTTTIHSYFKHRFETIC